MKPLAILCNRSPDPEDPLWKVEGYCEEVALPEAIERVDKLKLEGFQAEVMRTATKPWTTVYPI